MIKLTPVMFRLSQAAATILILWPLFLLFHLVEGKPAHLSEFEAGGITAVVILRLIQAFHAYYEPRAAGPAALHPKERNEMDADQVCRAINHEVMMINTNAGQDVFASQNDFQRMAREAEVRAALDAIAYNQRFPQGR